MPLHPLTPEQKRDLYLLANDYALLNVPNTDIWNLSAPDAPLHTFVKPTNARLYLQHQLMYPADTIEPDYGLPATIYKATPKAATTLGPDAALPEPPNEWMTHMCRGDTPTIVLPLHTADTPPHQATRFLTWTLNEHVITALLDHLAIPSHETPIELLDLLHATIDTPDDIRDLKHDAMNATVQQTPQPLADLIHADMTHPFLYAVDGLIPYEQATLTTATPLESLTPHITQRLTPTGITFRVTTNTTTHITATVPYAFLTATLEALPELRTSWDPQPFFAAIFKHLNPRAFAPEREPTSLAA